MKHCSCTSSSLELFIKSISGLQIAAASRPAFQRTQSAVVLSRGPLWPYTRLHGYSTSITEQHNADAASPPIPALAHAGSSSSPTRDDRYTAAQDKKTGRSNERLAKQRLAKQARREEPIRESRPIGGEDPKLKYAVQLDYGKSRTGGRTFIVRGDRRDVRTSTAKGQIGGRQRKVRPLSGASEAVERPERRTASDDSGLGRKARSSSAVDVEDKIVQSILKESEARYEPKQRKSPWLKAREPHDDATTKKRDWKEGLPMWKIQEVSLKRKFNGESWAPRKRVSPDSLNGIRALHASDPETYSTPVLAEHFKISPEAIRRILKSRWQPKEEEVEDRRRRWETRGDTNRKEITQQKRRSRNARYIRSITNPTLDPYMHEDAADEPPLFPSATSTVSDPGDLASRYPSASARRGGGHRSEARPNRETYAARPRSNF